jgi:hypothetical protein
MRLQGCNRGLDTPAAVQLCTCHAALGHPRAALPAVRTACTYRGRAPFIRTSATQRIHDQTFPGWNSVLLPNASIILAYSNKSGTAAAAESAASAAAQHPQRPSSRQVANLHRPAKLHTDLERMAHQRTDTRNRHPLGTEPQILDTEVRLLQCAACAAKPIHLPSHHKSAIHNAYTAWLCCRILAGRRVAPCRSATSDESPPFTHGETMPSARDGKRLHKKWGRGFRNGASQPSTRRVTMPFAQSNSLYVAKNGGFVCAKSENLPLARCETMPTAAKIVRRERDRASRKEWVQCAPRRARSA